MMGRILPNQNVYLHVIDFNPIFSKSDYSQTEIYDLLKSNLSYGIISAKPIEKICNFPLYLSSGQITVVLKENYKTLQLSEDEIKKIRSFHHLIFNDILCIIKNFMILHNKDEDMLLVVPIQKNSAEIDYNVILNNHKVYHQKQEPSGTDRLNLVVTDETHLGKIVTPWYRSDDIVSIILLLYTTS